MESNISVEFYKKDNQYCAYVREEGELGYDKGFKVIGNSMVDLSEKLTVCMNNYIIALDKEDEDDNDDAVDEVKRALNAAADAGYITHSASFEEIWDNLDDILYYSNRSADEFDVDTLGQAITEWRD